MTQSLGESGGSNSCAKRNNKKGRTNKSQKQQKIDKKTNVNGDNKSNNGVHLVGVKWMCLCNKGYVFYTSHTTDFNDTWSDCV